VGTWQSQTFKWLNRHLKPPSNKHIHHKFFLRVNLTALLNSNFIPLLTPHTPIPITLSPVIYTAPVPLTADNRPTAGIADYCVGGDGRIGGRVGGGEGEGMGVDIFLFILFIFIRLFLWESVPLILLLNFDFLFVFNNGRPLIFR